VKIFNRSEAKAERKKVSNHGRRPRNRVAILHARKDASWTIKSSLAVCLQDRNENKDRKEIMIVTAKSKGQMTEFVLYCDIFWLTVQRHTEEFKRRNDSHK